MHTGQGICWSRLLFAHRGSGYVWLSGFVQAAMHLQWEILRAVRLL